MFSLPRSVASRKFGAACRRFGASRRELRLPAIAAMAAGRAAAVCSRMHGGCIYIGQLDLCMLASSSRPCLRAVTFAVIFIALAFLVLPRNHSARMIAACMCLSYHASSDVLLRASSSRHAYNPSENFKSLSATTLAQLVMRDMSVNLCAFSRFTRHLSGCIARPRVFAICKTLRRR
jgi:hypothetical protein